MSVRADRLRLAADLIEHLEREDAPMPDLISSYDVGGPSVHWQKATQGTVGAVKAAMPGPWELQSWGPWVLGWRGLELAITPRQIVCACGAACDHEAGS